MTDAAPARRRVGWAARGAILLVVAGALLGGVALWPAPSEREREISRTFAPKAVSRLATVMRELDSVCDDIRKLLGDDAELALARPVVEIHGRTLAMLARETGVMTEGTEKTNQPVEEWVRLADAMAEAGKRLSEAAASAKTGLDELREAEGRLRRSCIDCHNLFVP